jgi:Ca2+-binding EF-hand superfamily protein
MSDRASLINELRVAAKRRGLVLDDLFQELDKAKSNNISLPSFRRILTTIGFWCPEERLTAVTQPYIVNNRDFRYRDFLTLDGDDAATPRGPPLTDSLAAFALDLDTRGIELNDVLAQYDVHRCGRVSTANFLRVLGPTPLNKTIAEHFGQSGTHEIDYLQLNQEVKKLVTTKYKPPLPTVERADLPPCWAQVALQIRERHLDYRNLLKALDRWKKRRIAPRAFIQELTQWGLKITAGEREQVAKAFVDANGQFDYELFCDEVAAAINTAPPAPTKSTFTSKPDIAKVLEFLRVTARHRHSQIEASIRELDPGNTGLIPAGRFARCMSASEFKITPDDANVLNEEFGDGRGNIDYERFLAEILPQSPSSLPDVSGVLGRLAAFLSKRKISIRPILERYKPLSIDDLFAVLRKLSFDLNPQEQGILRGAFRGRNIDVADFCDPIDYEPPKPEEPEAEPVPAEREIPPDGILGVLGKIVTVERRNKFDFLTEFRERDSFKNGQMPVSQFQAILLASGAGITKAEAELLIDQYRVSPQKVDYSSLIVDKDKVAEGEAIGAEPTQSVDEVLARFKLALQERKLPAQDLFVKYDRFRTGTVLAVRVRSIFDSIGVKLTEGEDKALREAFVDPQSVDMFDYNKLCELLAPPAQKAGHDRDLLLLLTSLRERIQARRRKIREAFPDSLGETIGEQEFRKAISSFGLSIREPEVQRLLKYYRVNRQKEVDWRSFVTDAENVRIPNG